MLPDLYGGFSRCPQSRHRIRELGLALPARRIGGSDRRAKPQSRSADRVSGDGTSPAVARLGIVTLGQWVQGSRNLRSTHALEGDTGAGVDGAAVGARPASSLGAHRDCSRGRLSRWFRLRRRASSRPVLFDGRIDAYLARARFRASGGNRVRGQFGDPRIFVTITLVAMVSADHLWAMFRGCLAAAWVLCHRSAPSSIRGVSTFLRSPPSPSPSDLPVRPHHGGRRFGRHDRPRGRPCAPPGSLIGPCSSPAPHRSRRSRLVRHRSRHGRPTVALHERRGGRHALGIGSRRLHGPALGRDRQALVLIGGPLRTIGQLGTS